MFHPRSRIASPPFARLLPVGLVFAFLGGCEAEALELAGDIASARGECTAERLQASDEECVRMMERYAGIGMDLMRTSIGGVKALDRALARMPDPRFDTAGIGYAISPEFRGGDALGRGASPRTLDIATAQASRSSATGMIGAPGAPTYHRAAGEEWRAAGHAGPAVSRAAPGYGPARYGYAAPDRRAYDYDPRPSNRYRRVEEPDRRDPTRDPTRERIRRRVFGFDALGWYDGWDQGFSDTYAYGFLESSPYGYFYRGGWDRYGYGAPYGGPRPPYGYGGWDSYSRSYAFEPYGYYGGGWSDPRGREYPYASVPGVGWQYGSAGRGRGYDDRAYAEAGEPAPRSDNAPGWSRSASEYGAGEVGRSIDDSAISPQEDWGYRGEDTAAEVAPGNSASGASSAVARPTPHRPGILLPPEERLRRPWIDD